MLDTSKKKELIKKCILVFYGLPIGMNAEKDAPIVGNKSLAQVVTNRIKSTAKNYEEFAFMTQTIIMMLRDTKGQVISKIKFNENTGEMVRSGLTNSKGFAIASSKKKKVVEDLKEEESKILPSK